MGNSEESDKKPCNLLFFDYQYLAFVCLIGLDEASRSREAREKIRFHCEGRVRVAKTQTTGPSKFKMAKTVLQKYNMYLALTIHLTGFLAALITGKHLYRYRLFPIIKSLLVTLTCTALFTNGVSIIGSILLINFGQSLSTCTIAIYNMSVAPLTSTVLMACLAIDRFYMAKKKVPNVRKIQSWNMLAIILTALFGHMPIVLSVLERPIPFVAQCAGFEDDQPDNWFGFGVASIIFVSWVITACYTFKLKRIFKNSMKNRYSRKIPNNLMKIGKFQP